MRKPILLFGILGTLLTHVGSAAACAAGAVSPGGDLGANTQRIFLSATPSLTHVVVQAAVPTSRESYGILIPVPVRPTLDPTPVDSADLEALDAATRPTIIDETPSESGGLCGAKSVDAGGLRNGVDIIDTVTIGPLVAVVLTASVSDALVTWLSDNGFQIPASGRQIVDRYAIPGGYFIAAKRADTATSDAPSSLGIHFELPGEQLTIPIPIAQLGAPGEVSLAVFAASERPLGPSNPYAALGLEDLSRDTIRESGYRTGVANLVSSHVGQAFISEGVNPAKDVLTGKLSTLVSGTAVLTRLVTVADPTQFQSDLTLSPSVAPSTVDSLEVTEASGCGAAAPVSPLIVVGLLLFRSRQRASRSRA